MVLFNGDKSHIPTRNLVKSLHIIIHLVGHTCMLSLRLPISSLQLVGN